MTWSVRWLQAEQFGPVALGLGALSLALLVTTSELLWGLLVASVGVAVWGLWSHQRWPVALIGVFVWSLLGFQLRALGSVSELLALLAIFVAAVGLATWLLPSDAPQAWATAWAGGLGLLELFVLLLFWPINFPSRALILVAAALLLFELIERQQRGLRFGTLLGSAGLAVAAILSAAVSADWYGF